jgi:DNA polymerase III delta prime subunit
MKTSVKAGGASAIQIKRTLYLSHFTPSMMAPETLEAMLVQREPLLTRTVAHVVESLRTGSRHHTLFVGPRGIGKTHLISLLHHRLAKTKEAKSKALIAWMREEEWGVTSFFELVMRILRTLDASYPAFNIAERTQPLYELKIDDAAKQAESLLLDVVADKCLVILLENLDDLFDQIGDQGQKAWRAFIQNHSNMLLVCTTPSLFAGVSVHKSAFYGFFDIEPLAELEFEDVVNLLRKIAVERGDGDLVAFIDTPEGRARIRAVHHLAEGNPRIYIIFAQFLSHEALDELVQAFMHTLDELTPYYQARMKELPGQQRKIAEYLVHYRGAATVKAIAKACFITQQVCSSQLKQLKDKRYVRSIEQGRESFYELCEPLMRLCMEVKKQRGEPVSLFVEILRIWYTQAELEKKISDKLITSLLELEYVQRALSKYQVESTDPKVLAVTKDLMKVSVEGNIPKFMGLIEELKAVGGDINVALLSFGMGTLAHNILKKSTSLGTGEDQSWLVKATAEAMKNLIFVLMQNPSSPTIFALAVEERRLLEAYAGLLPAKNFSGTHLG